MLDIIVLINQNHTHIFFQNRSFTYLNKNILIYYTLYSYIDIYLYTTFCISGQNFIYIYFKNISYK